MEQAYEKQFMSLETEVPCCKKIVSLNNLKYYSLCAFACCVIIILNPSSNIENDIIDCVQKILCTEICVIKKRI